MSPHERGRPCHDDEALRRQTERGEHGQEADKAIKMIEYLKFSNASGRFYSARDMDLGGPLRHPQKRGGR